MQMKHFKFMYHIRGQAYLDALDKKKSFIHIDALDKKKSIHRPHHNYVDMILYFIVNFTLQRMLQYDIA